MGQIKPPKRAKLFCGLLSADEDLLAETRRRLPAFFGTIDLVSDMWPFDSTDYYALEMGEEIKRQFVFFEALVSVERLAAVKRLTNDLEAKLCDDLVLPHERRPVNIDPGYMTLSKFVLATTKDYSHRIYVQRGIYAEVTLHYESGGWRAWPWTYPDYAGDTYHAFFNQAREVYKRQLQE
ncbi:MAG TPA: DUF4416 family protein [Phycisphaerae bacterium]|nr:DUF4416 family protein [Phycisphaerae bacterium]